MDKFLAGIMAAGLTGTAGAAVPAGKPTVDVVFILDTTGSMGRMIEAAKAKVWAIANEVAKGKPAPVLRVGLVAYRDRGDAYVTKVTDLTRDLDKMYAELMTLRAEGGGDEPEHVLKALEDADAKVSWSADRRALKVAYLIGDAPAHLDYGDTPALETLVERLVRRGIIVNTIQCGSGGATQEQWTRIARLGEGRYTALDHEGGVVAAATPFDARLAELSAKLDGTALAFGARRESAAADMASLRGMMASAPAGAAAERAVYRAKGGFAGESDLLEAVDAKRVDLAAAKDAELPPALQGKDAAGRKRELERVRKEREAIKGEIGRVASERDAWRRTNVAEKKDSFDAQLLASLKEQAARKGISY